MAEKKNLSAPITSMFTSIYSLVVFLQTRDMHGEAPLSQLFNFLYLLKFRVLRAGPQRRVAGHYSPVCIDTGAEIYMQGMLVNC